MILNSPTISGSLTVTGNIIASGSITLSGSVASASYAATASFVALAQSASNAVAAATASSADNLLVRNTLTAQTLVVQTITSSVDFVTGSTRFGSISENTHQFTGSMSVSGSATFSGYSTFSSSINEVARFKSSYANGMYITFESASTIIGDVGNASETFTGASTLDFGINARGNRKLQFGTHQSVIMTITGSNVGVGINTPSSILHLLDTSANDTTLTIGQAGEVPTIKAGGTNTDLRIEAVGAGGYIELRTNGTSRMFVTGTGRITLRNSANTVVNAMISSGFGYSVGSYPILIIGQNASGPGNTSLAFNVDVSDNPSGAFSGAGQEYIWRNAGSFITPNSSNNGYNTLLSWNSSGVVTVTTSDYRAKEDLKSFEALPMVQAMKLYDFRWIELQNRMHGVLAHELQDIVPYAVMGEKDGDRMQGVDYSKLVPIMLKAIQELQAQITELKNK